MLLLQGIPFPTPDRSTLSSDDWVAFHRQRPQGSGSSDRPGSESWFYTQQAADAMQAMFAKYAQEGGASVQGAQLSALQAELFDLAPRLGGGAGGAGRKASDGTAGDGGGFPNVLLSCTNLRRLRLSFQGITALPDSIGRLQKLVELDLAHCIRLETISGELGLLVNLNLSE